MIQQIQAVDTHPLRINVMGQQNPVKPADDAPSTRHFGAFKDGTLVGVASIYEETPSDGIVNAWRLRGMATLPDVRGQGYGAQLVYTCIDHIKSVQGELFWCNARLNVVGFYEKFGFTTIGEPFHLSGHGERYRMHCPIKVYKI